MIECLQALQFLSTFIVALVYVSIKIFIFFCNLTLRPAYSRLHTLCQNIPLLTFRLNFDSFLKIKSFPRMQIESTTTTYANGLKIFCQLKKLHTNFYLSRYNKYYKVLMRCNLIKPSSVVGSHSEGCTPYIMLVEIKSL